MVVIVGIVSLELYASFFVFSHDSTRGKVYSKLLWEIRDKTKDDFLEQPYLGYSNRPNLEKEKPINNLGLVRSTNIDIEKQPGVLRILFLGGPSTYGMAVENAEQTFPLVLEGLLNDKVDSLTNGKFSSVECLNAGLSGATSAEILTQYLFKFKYLQPDIVVIHAGFNDAYTHLCKSYGVQYQPDYHTAKKVYRNILPASGGVKCLLWSKFFAWAYISSRNDLEDYLNATPAFNTFYQFTNNELWFTHGNDSIFSLGYNAYYNNLKNLITVARAHNQQVLLVPEIYKKYDPLFGDGNEDWFIKCITQNTAFARKLAQEKMAYICELDKATFSSDMYPEGEDRYLNEKGEKNKAKQILPCIINLINRKEK